MLELGGHGKSSGARRVFAVEMQMVDVWIAVGVKGQENREECVFQVLALLKPEVQGLLQLGRYHWSALAVR